jgi:hypothetical protein
VAEVADMPSQFEKDVQQAVDDRVIAGISVMAIDYTGLCIIAHFEA